MKKINYADMLNVVNKVVNGCFDVDENNEQVYYPENKDFYWRYNILSTFTDMKLSQDLNECFNEVYSDEAEAKLSLTYEENKPMLDNILKSINEKIEYKIRQNKPTTDKALIEFIENLNNSITMLEMTIEDKINSIDTSVFDKKNMGEIMSLVSKVKDINPDEIAKAAIKTKTIKKSK